MIKYCLALNLPKFGCAVACSALNHPGPMAPQIFFLWWLHSSSSPCAIANLIPRPPLLPAICFHIFRHCSLASLPSTLNSLPFFLWGKYLRIVGCQGSTNEAFGFNWSIGPVRFQLQFGFDSPASAGSYRLVLLFAYSLCSSLFCHVVPYEHCLLGL